MIVNFLQQVISMGGILEITIKMERRIDIHKIRGNHALLQFWLLRGGGVVFHPQKSLFGVVLDLEAVFKKNAPNSTNAKSLRGKFWKITKPQGKYSIP